MSEQQTNVVVCGAAGRMGRRFVALVAGAGAEDLMLLGAVEREGHEALFEDAGTLAGVRKLSVPVRFNVGQVVSDWQDNDLLVVVDFTTPEAAVVHARVCAEYTVPLVTGTTGLSHDQQAEVEACSRDTAIVQAPNFSVGIALLLQVVEEAARLLGDGYDIEVIEAHHHFKEDAPSGTALALARAAAAARGWEFDEVRKAGRVGMVGERPKEEIGIHAIRAGDIVGEHTVLFGGIGEQILLVHRAQSRDTFAMGALRAVRFVVGAKPGLYDMRDVLGLK